MRRKQNAPSDEPEITRYEINGVHWYKLRENGKCQWLTSVTRFTGHYPKGPAFDKWLASQGGFDNAQKIKEEAGDKGHNVHAGIERLLKGESLQLEDFTADEWKHLMSFANWFEDFRPEVLAVEEIVYSVRNQVAGTLDLRCRIGGKNSVVDHKTAGAIYRTHEVQVNEYGHMAREMGHDVEVAAVLRTGSRHKRGYEFKSWPLCEKTHQLFECLLQIGRDFDPAIEPKIENLPSELKLGGLAIRMDAACQLP